MEKYVITTAQYNAPVNKELYNSIKKYCTVNNAQLIILSTSGRNITEDQIINHLLEEDSEIQFWDNKKINNNLKVKDFGVRPQAINPLTGLERFAQGESSYIMPGTKQVLKYIANSINSLPKAIMTTGAITKPYYNEKHRIGKIAKADHTYGMVVVEVESPSYFHFRHIKSMKNGKFVDLGMLYNNNKKPKKLRTLAHVPGDIHAYDLNKTHKKLTFNQFEYFNPENVFLHDLFNGKSISHHYKGHNSRAFEAYNLQGMNLENELKETLKVLKEYAYRTKGNLYVVASNHDEHLLRYLDEGRFINDKGNDLIASKIYAGLLEGKYPLEYGMSLIGDIPNNVIFLQRDDDLKIRGYQLARHGDMGASGARGSVRTLEIGSGKSISGHKHTALIQRNVYVVGTSTDLKLDYNKGYYSSWTNTNAVLYEDGSVQLLNSINRKWKL